MTKHLVIVESPAKAKTINKFLGSDYQVLASYGHIRDLLPKNGSVKTDEDYDMIYELNSYSKKHIDNLIKAAKTVDSIMLAPDPDREGEAIAWHIFEVLKEKKAIKKDTKVQRIVFSEITKKAITEAISNPREINLNLVQSQQARRALDYLVGFNLSPILWRKLPGSKSAGRVQSVALRLIADRDDEIEKFISREYWSIKGLFLNVHNENINSFLHSVNGKKLEKFDVIKQDQADNLVEQIKKNNFQISNIEKKPFARRPQPPFITSTLQQEAARKLGFYSKKTMKIAQELYEGIKIDQEQVGLITYMRTDGVQLSTEAVNQSRDLIEKKYGKDYLPEKPVFYKSKSLNAQEAHEAIRPTILSYEPDSIRSYLTDDQFKLYSLIWKRTVACQMTAAKFETTSVDITSQNQEFNFRANGTVMLFDGYKKLYIEGSDDTDQEEEGLLPRLNIGDSLDLSEVTANQHFTEPPARYSEASFVKKLEELGIGRPSTYATIISVIQDRNYVRMEKKRFICEDRGRVVTSFLIKYFNKYVQYDYTAGLENELDEVSSGKLVRNKLLDDFWLEFKNNVDDVATKSNQEVIEYINEDLSDHFFPKKDGDTEKKCPSCIKGDLSIKAGKYGVFIACSDYPECKYTRQVDNENNSTDGEQADQNLTPEGKTLGKYQDTDKDMYLKKGPYGFYVEMSVDDKPKRASIPKHIDVASLDNIMAAKILSLPRVVGNHPETQEEIKVGFGKYGPFVLYKAKYYPLTKGDVLDVELAQCLDIISQKQQKSEAIELGNHPDTKEAIQILSGRYGPYLKYNKKNIPIPKTIAVDNLSLDQAIEIINNKISK
jgi:DNA topoisomerase I